MFDFLSCDTNHVQGGLPEFGSYVSQAWAVLVPNQTQTAYAVTSGVPGFAKTDPIFVFCWFMY